MDAHEDVKRIKRSKPLWVAVFLVLASPVALRELNPAQAKAVCTVVSTLFGIVALVAGYGVSHFTDVKEEADAEEARLQHAEDQKRQADANAQNAASVAALAAKFEAFTKAQTELVRLPSPPAKGASQGVSDHELTASGLSRREFEEFSQHLSKGHDAFLKGQVEFVSKRYREAVLLFDEAAANAERLPSEPDLAALQKRRAGVALASGGLAYKALRNTDESLRRFRDALKYLDEDSQRAVRAEAQGMIALLLLERAQRTKGDTRISRDSGQTNAESEAIRVSSIHEGIDLAISAQKIFGAIGTSKDLAWISNTLGTGYSLLSEAAGSPESERLLQLALSEYKGALSAIDKTSVPELWAIIKGNSGAVLQRMAESKTPDEERSLLLSAVAETNAAGEVLSFKNFPELWAKNQQLLATAYRDLAVAADDPNQYRSDAIDCYRNALSVLTSEGDPLRWAVAQQDLSLLLYLHATTNPMLAQKLFLEAQTANDLAATVFTRARNPEAWAHGRAVAADIKLGLIPFVQEQTARALMSEVKRANEDALQVFTKKDYPVEWGRTKVVIAGTMIIDAQRDKARGKMLTALAMLKDAESALTQDLAPIDFGRLRLTQGSGLYTMAALKREETRSLLTQSIAAYQSGIDCLQRRKVPGSGALLGLLKLSRERAQSALEN